MGFLQPRSNFLNEKNMLQETMLVLPFTQGKRSVYRLGRFGQMVSKFPYWENSVRDWRLPFAEIPTIYQKNCMTATANEKVAKQKL